MFSVALLVQNYANVQICNAILFKFYGILQLNFALVIITSMLSPVMIIYLDLFGWIKISNIRVCSFKH